MNMSDLKCTLPSSERVLPHDLLLLDLLQQWGSRRSEVSFYLRHHPSLKQGNVHQSQATTSSQQLQLSSYCHLHPRLVFPCSSPVCHLCWLASMRHAARWSNKQMHLADLVSLFVDSFELVWYLVLALPQVKVQRREFLVSSSTGFTSHWVPSLWAPVTGVVGWSGKTLWSRTHLREIWF